MRIGCLLTLVLLVVLALLVWWAYTDSNTQLERTDLDVVSDTLPDAFDGLRIAHLSDLHGAEYGPRNADLVRLVRNADPDLIALTGDFVDAENRAAKLLTFRELCSQLVEIAPVYYVSGNHEWSCDAMDEIRDILEETGVHYLDNRYLPLTRGEDTLYLGGLIDPNGPYDAKGMAEIAREIRVEGDDPFTLMLSHRNVLFEDYVEAGFDVVFSGHGHGGLIRLPVVGGLVGTDRTLFPDYTAGVYREGDTAMVVSRGLGNGPAKIRLFNRPEVLVVTLRNRAPYDGDSLVAEAPPIPG